MGNKESTEVRYEYKDDSAQVQNDEYEREQERLANQRKANQEHEKRMAEVKDLEQKELERKANTFRDQLTEYRFGFFTNVASFRGLSISDIDQIRIGVFGPTGSGKTCFISTAERVIRGTERGSAAPKVTGAEGTIVLLEYLHEMFFRLVDTRGMFTYGTGEIKELENILYGRIRPGEVIARQPGEEGYGDVGPSTPVKDWVHAVIIVVMADDPRLMSESFRSYFAPIRERFRPKGIFPITLVTHGDQLESNEEKERARRTASSATGSAMDHTFLISNYTPEKPERRIETELQVLELFRFALLVAEKYIKIAKQQIAIVKANEPVNEEDIQSVSVEVFMRTLQVKYQWKDTLVDQTVALFREQDLTSVSALATCWSDIKNHITAVVVRDKVEKELEDLNLNVQ